MKIVKFYVQTTINHHLQSPSTCSGPGGKRCQNIAFGVDVIVCVVSSMNGARNLYFIFNIISYIYIWCGIEHYIQKFTIRLSRKCFSWSSIHNNMQTLTRPPDAGKTLAHTIRKHMDQRHSTSSVWSSKIAKHHPADEPIMIFLAEKKIWFSWMRFRSGKIVCDLYLI